MTKDIFLRRKMDSEGCIPISLIATFNRVKALTQDIQLILKAVDVSDIVELVDGVKVSLSFIWIFIHIEKMSSFEIVRIVDAFFVGSTIIHSSK